jgi:hypothetical protein
LPTFPLPDGNDFGKSGPVITSEIVMDLVAALLIAGICLAYWNWLQRQKR